MNTMANLGMKYGQITWQEYLNQTIFQENSDQISGPVGYIGPA